MERVLQYIDDHSDEYVACVQRLCRQPSIAAQNLGMAETAQMITDILRQIGADARTVPTAGHPVVFGQIDGPAGSKTLGFYNHYDVQRTDPLAEWESPPFEPTVRGGRLYARGVTDDKGDVLSRMAAVVALRAVEGELPITVKFLVEGEEIETIAGHIDAGLPFDVRQYR